MTKTLNEIDAYKPKENLNCINKNGDYKMFSVEENCKNNEQIYFDNSIADLTSCHQVNQPNTVFFDNEEGVWMNEKSINNTNYYDLKQRPVDINKEDLEYFVSEIQKLRKEAYFSDETLRRLSDEQIFEILVEHVRNKSNKPKARTKTNTTSTGYVNQLYSIDNEREDDIPIVIRNLHSVKSLKQFFEIRAKFDHFRPTDIYPEDTQHLIIHRPTSMLPEPPQLTKFSEKNFKTTESMWSYDRSLDKRQLSFRELHQKLIKEIHHKSLERLNRKNSVSLEEFDNLNEESSPNKNEEKHSEVEHVKYLNQDDNFKAEIRSDLIANNFGTNQTSSLNTIEVFEKNLAILASSANFSLNSSIGYNDRLESDQNRDVGCGSTKSMLSEARAKLETLSARFKGSTNADNKYFDESLNKKNSSDSTCKKNSVDLAQTKF